MKTLFKVRFGSHLYGTNTPESDTDYKSVHVPDAADIIMQRVQPVILYSTGDTSTKNTSDDVDDESIALGKFISMLKSGDMIAYELLFVTEDQAEVWTPEWGQMIHTYRRAMIDKNISGFIGYIRQQVNKYGVKGSRIAAARAAMEMLQLFLDHSELDSARVSDIPAETINRLITDHNEHCYLLALPLNRSHPERVGTFLEVLNRKIPFNIKVTEALKMVTKIFDEYGARALAAENNQGVDWKAVYHAIRVSEQALELMKTGNITFPRPNVEELLTIRRGDIPFKEVANQLENNLAKLEELVHTSKILQDRANEAYMDGVHLGLYLKQIEDELSG